MTRTVARRSVVERPSPYLRGSTAISLVLERNGATVTDSYWVCIQRLQARKEPAE